MNTRISGLQQATSRKETDEHEDYSWLTWTTRTESRETKPSSPSKCKAESSPPRSNSTPPQVDDTLYIECPSPCGKARTYLARVSISVAGVATLWVQDLQSEVEHIATTQLPSSMRHSGSLKRAEQEAPVLRYWTAVAAQEQEPRSVQGNTSPLKRRRERRAAVMKQRTELLLGCGISELPPRLVASLWNASGCASPALKGWNSTPSSRAPTPTQKTPPGTRTRLNSSAPWTDEQKEAWWRQMATPSLY